MQTSAADCMVLVSFSGGERTLENLDDVLPRARSQKANEISSAFVVRLTDVLESALFPKHLLGDLTLKRFFW